MRFIRTVGFQRLAAAVAIAVIVASARLHSAHPVLPHGPGVSSREILAWLRDAAAAACVLGSAGLLALAGRVTAAHEGLHCTRARPVPVPEPGPGRRREQAVPPPAYRQSAPHDDRAAMAVHGTIRAPGKDEL